MNCIRRCWHRSPNLLTSSHSHRAPCHCWCPYCRLQWSIRQIYSALRRQLSILSQHSMQILVLGVIDWSHDRIHLRKRWNYQKQKVSKLPIENNMRTFCVCDIQWGNSCAQIQCGKHDYWEFQTIFTAQSNDVTFFHTKFLLQTFSQTNRIRSHHIGRQLFTGYSIDLRQGDEQKKNI